MKNIRISDHAAASMKERSINMDSVLSAISDPDSLTEGTDSRKIYSKRYLDSALSREMLLRVIVEDRPLETIVITVYKTSQFARYT
jgi:hypothetical protein